MKKVKIKSIKKIEGKFIKYDLQTRDNHNFFANHLLVHNSSLTVIWCNGELKVCSRRLELKEGDGAFWRAVKKYDLPAKLAALNKNIAIQSECVGPKLNGNQLGLQEIDMFVFNIKDLDNMRYFDYEEIVKFTQDLGLKMVPVIETGVFNKSIEDLQTIANSVKYPNGAVGEGIVIRTCKFKHSYVLNKMCSVKLISQEYKD